MWLKVASCGKKWFYVVKSGFMWLKVFYVGISGTTNVNVVFSSSNYVCPGVYRYPSTFRALLGHYLFWIDNL